MAPRKSRSAATSRPSTTESALDLASNSPNRRDDLIAEASGTRRRQTTTLRRRGRKTRNEDAAPGKAIWSAAARRHRAPTVTAKRLLEHADVVLHDKLPGPEILERIPEEKREDVGKRAGGEWTPQEYTNRRLVELAREGKTVVRLKGGDPFVFGRGGEEWTTSRKTGFRSRSSRVSRSR